MRFVEKDVWRRGSPRRVVDEGLGGADGEGVQPADGQVADGRPGVPPADPADHRRAPAPEVYYVPGPDLVGVHPPPGHRPAPVLVGRQVPRGRQELLQTDFLGPAGVKVYDLPAALDPAGPPA